MFAEKEFLQQSDTVFRKKVSEVFSGRAVFYEMLAGLYFSPLTQNQIEQVAHANLLSDESVNIEFDKGVADIVHYLLKRNSGTRQELAVDYTSSFGGVHTCEGRYALPYKSFFSDGERAYFAEGHTEVFNVYKQACVKKRDGLDYPDDHLSFLCDFMSLLSCRAKKALEEGDFCAAKLSVDQSRSFLEDEILSWFDEFSNLAGHIVNTRFYRGVLSLTKGYFLLDLEVLRDLADEIGMHDA